MDYQQILYSLDEGTLTITLNRPEKLNALTKQMFTELHHAVDRADADDAVRVVVFTGAGKAFCAGADLELGADAFSADNPDSILAAATTGGEPGWQAVRDPAGRFSLRLYAMKKPVIAALNGAAVGAGATIATAMDIRFAAENIKLGYVFARRGIVVDGCSSWFLPRIVGPAKALDWTLSGRVFSVDEALQAGLVSSVHKPETLLAAAYDWAREVAENTSPVSVGLNRQLIYRMAAMDHPAYAHAAETRGVYYTGMAADAAEGVSSFLEKRAAVYTTRVSSDFPDIFSGFDEPDYR